MNYTIMNNFFWFPPFHRYCCQITTRLLVLLLVLFVVFVIARDGTSSSSTNKDDKMSIKRKIDSQQAFSSSSSSTVHVATTTTSHDNMDLSSNEKQQQKQQNDQEKGEEKIQQQQQSVPHRRAPNIILLLTDDQDVLLGGIEQMKYLRTLFMEQQQQQQHGGGRVFRNAFVHTPVCCPSRMSILTGKYLHNLHVYNNSISGNCNGLLWQQQHESIHTIATYAQQYFGYQTSYAGKYLNQYAVQEDPGCYSQQQKGKQKQQQQEEKSQSTSSSFLHNNNDDESSGNNPKNIGVNEEQEEEEELNEEVVTNCTRVPPGWDHWFGLVGNSVYYNYDVVVYDKYQYNNNSNSNNNNNNNKKKKKKNNGSFCHEDGLWESIPRRISYGDQYETDYLPDVLVNRTLCMIETFTTKTPTKKNSRNNKRNNSRHSSNNNNNRNMDDDTSKTELYQPFLVVNAWPSPHDPFTPAPWAEHMFDDTTTYAAHRTPNYNASYESIQNKHWLVRQLTFIDTKTAQWIDTAYQQRLATLLSIDEHIKRIVDLLHELQIYNDTIILYTSDNGFQLGQHRFMTDKRHLYEHDIRVPFIVAGGYLDVQQQQQQQPDQDTRKQQQQQQQNKQQYYEPYANLTTVNDIVLNIDIAPTFVELMSINIMNHNDYNDTIHPRDLVTTILNEMDGISFAPLLLSQQQQELLQQERNDEQQQFNDDNNNTNISTVRSSIPATMTATIETEDDKTNQSIDRILSMANNSSNNNNMDDSSTRGIETDDKDELITIVPYRRSQQQRRYDFLISYHGEGLPDCGMFPCPPPPWNEYHGGLMPDSYNNTYHCVRTILVLSSSDFTNHDNASDQNDIMMNHNNHTTKTKTTSLTMINTIYCQFMDDEQFIEYYDLYTDPYQLNNTYCHLSTLTRQYYQQRLQELLHCQGLSCQTSTANTNTTTTTTNVLWIHLVEEMKRQQ